MTSAHLPDFIDNAEYELRLLLPVARSGGLDARGARLLCDTFRQRGVCSFLLSADPRPFFDNAMYSAGAYLAYLDQAPATEKVTSWAAPFYDAIGCGFAEAARDIAERSKHEWTEGREYQDDFLFVHFLMMHAFLGADEDECRAILARHDKAAQGAEDARGAVGLAILERDAAGFDTALRQILDDRAEKVEAMVERGAMPEEHWAWLRYFSNEGFGLLGIARHLGIETGRRYLHVSDRLRGAGRDFDADAWKTAVRDE